MDKNTSDYLGLVLKQFNSLVIYRNLHQNNLVSKLIDYLENSIFYEVSNNEKTTLGEIIDLFIQEAEKNSFSGNIFKKIILKYCLEDENIYSMACESKNFSDKSSLYKIILNDIEHIMNIADMDLSILLGETGLDELIINYTPNSRSDKDDNINNYTEELFNISNTEELEKKLRWFYSNFGCGSLGQYPMLKYSSDNKLIPIKNYDKVKLNDIIGYEEQKRELINNTKAFLEGFEANNTLLVGARGTGKSSVVKAVVNKYFDEGLRLIEISKDQLNDLPSILNLITHRGKKFIIFLDDLSFDEFEIQYKHLKSLLEGSAEIKPKNVLFYATSNRRHIIAEKWADKSGSVIADGEIHASDTMNEKLSLSDRFGLTLTFGKPSPTEFYNIVEGIAKREGLELTKDFIREQSAKWELNQSGLSGRTARQYVNNLLWEIQTENLK